MAWMTMIEGDDIIHSENKNSGLVLDYFYHVGIKAYTRKLKKINMFFKPGSHKSKNRRYWL